MSDEWTHFVMGFFIGFAVFDTIARFQKDAENDE